MRTMYVPGSETHVHSDYIIGHHHTLLKVNSGNSTLLHQDVEGIHRVLSIIKVRKSERNRYGLHRQLTGGLPLT
jgi:hypothetical protein